MIIKPKTRGFICTTAHPIGCKKHVAEQIETIKSQYSHLEKDQDIPKNVLIIGCSTGYGLASRIAASFGYGAKTLGVMFEKEPTEKRTASAGWYNNQAFEAFAKESGYFVKTLNIDAFSQTAKEQVIEEARSHLDKIDLVIYSLASPRRKDPFSGVVYSSTLKPIQDTVTRKTLDTDKKVVHDVTLEPASLDEISQTIKVMGGEDWELWINALLEAELLSQNVKTTAYTYIGKELTWPIYGKATIGKAKEDLDRAAAALNARLKEKVNGQAHVSVLKAVVTQSSSAIPVMPLYISLLFKVMKEQGSHEGCIEQAGKLFEHLYANKTLSLDDSQRIRVDLPELEDKVQNAVEQLWQEVNTENLDELSDFSGYQEEFFKLFGFGLKNVDYEQDVDPRVID
ncbi:MAG: enoyl-ACP reductase FabV [Pseudomonadota bacterium]